MCELELHQIVVVDQAERVGVLERVRGLVGPYELVVEKQEIVENVQHGLKQRERDGLDHEEIHVVGWGSHVHFDEGDGLGRDSGDVFEEIDDSEEDDFEELGDFVEPFQDRERGWRRNPYD